MDRPPETEQPEKERWSERVSEYISGFAYVRVEVYVAFALFVAGVVLILLGIIARGPCLVPRPPAMCGA